MDRRNFLRGMIAAGTAAIAAEFRVSEAVGAEILEELEKDLGREVYGPPKSEFLGNDVVETPKMWTSTANIREFYIKEVKKAVPDAYDSVVRRSVNRMQLCITDDLRRMADAGVPEGQVILEAPKVVPKGKGQFELIAGAKPEKSFLGTDIITVGYIAGAPEILRDTNEARDIGRTIITGV